MGNFVEVKHLTKAFPGSVQAVNDVSFAVKEGDFMTLLGPSGCGKTTTLRCIAGLEKPDRGEIVIGGEVYFSSEKGIFTSPSRRNIGMVFQSYAVWPHMNVFENIAYGLKMKHARKEEIREKVDWAMDIVGLQGLAGRQVTKLSGGQQQRVAVARALAYSPRVLLFDEPLSNLDAKLRERMRLELIKLQREIGITSIYVTHDQAEAMVISDEVIVMRNGVIEQIGDPKSIYNQPQSRFVADFIGIANFLEGEIVEKVPGKAFGVVKVSDGIRTYTAESTMAEDLRDKDEIVFFFRPEHTSVAPGPQAEGKNRFAGKISKIVYLGNYIDCRVSIGKKEIRAQLSAEQQLVEEREACVEVDPAHCICLKK